MRLFLLLVILLTSHYMSWGQDEYRSPRAPQVFTFADQNLEIDPASDIKFGTMYMMKANNHQYVAAGCFALGYIALNSELRDNKSDHVLSNSLFISGALFSFAAAVQYRKGIERLYLGANGITVKLTM